MARRADEFDHPDGSDDEALFRCVLGLSITDATRQVAHEAFRLAGDRYHAEDLGQDAMLRVIRWLRDRRISVPIENPRGWLRSVVASQWISDHRSSKRQKRGGGAVDLPLEQAANERSHVGEPQAALLRRERQRTVRRAVSTLPAAQQAVVVRAALGYPLSEIAVILGLPLGTVKRQAFDAHQRLRANLNRDV